MKLKPTILKTTTSILAGFPIIYIITIFMCRNPPCLTKKNEFLLTIFMSDYSFFFIALLIIISFGIYLFWSWKQK